MTNEEILEELYYIANKEGVFLQFSEKVNALLKNSNDTIYEVATKVHFDFIEKGLIGQSYH